MGLVFQGPRQPALGVKGDTGEFQPGQRLDATKFNLRGPFQAGLGQGRTQAVVQRPQHPHIPGRVCTLGRTECARPVGGLQMFRQGQTQFLFHHLFETMADAQPGFEHLAGQHGIKNGIGPGTAGGDKEFQIKLGMVEQPAARGTEQGEERFSGDATHVKQIGVVRRCDLDKPEGVFAKVQSRGFRITG